MHWCKNGWFIDYVQIPNPSRVGNESPKSVDDFEKRGKTQNIQEDAANHNPKIKAIALNFTKSFELGVFFHDLSIATATRHPAVWAYSTGLNWTKMMKIKFLMCTLSTVVTRTWPPLKVRFITANVRSITLLTLLIARFLRFSLMVRERPRTARFMVLSIDARGFTQKYPLSRYIVSPGIERSTWLSWTDAIVVSIRRIRWLSLSIRAWSVYPKYGVSPLFVQVPSLHLRVFPSFPRDASDEVAPGSAVMIVASWMTPRVILRPLRSSWAWNVFQTPSYFPDSIRRSRKSQTVEKSGISALNPMNFRKEMRSVLWRSSSGSERL